MLGKFENSGYNAHAHCPDIIQIEDEEQDLSPIEVANNYLTNGWAYPQKASGKSRDYYEEILRLTKSAVLTHNFEKPPRHSSRNIELPFQFSKIEILKFITKKQWGIDPTRIRELPPHFSPRHFNYFDYIDAWNHVLLYQNPSHKHSWFIFFSRNFDGNFPNWIANWWLNYGPDFEEWPSTQIGITSLTKEGLDTHVWAALRDDRHLSFDDSLLGMSNPDKTNVMLPRRIKFNELTPPEDWIIENKATHRQVNPQNTQIDHIIETPEGDGIRNTNSSVPETMYTVETPSEMPSSSGQNQNNYNPSVHDFDYNVLVIEDFQIDHKKLNDEFYAKHSRTNRAWYRISFSTEQRAQYKELFFQTLKAYKTYFPFFGWFYSYCLDNNIEIPEYMNPQKQINVFKRITREWYIWPTHEKQESIYPLFNKFAMKGDMNSNFLAAPLKHIVDTSTSNHFNYVTAGEIQSLAEQSNYTNIILSTIGEQTTRIEDTIFQVKDVVSDFYSKMQPPKGISDNIFGISPCFNLASSSSPVVRNIEQPLIKPSIDLDSRFKLNSEEPSGSESEIEPDKLEKQFITAIGATNSRPPLRNYYTRPTPVDMQLEEKNFSNPSSFNGSSIYEWNLDGMTDYQVITLLQHMLMAANSARNRNLGESEAVIARYLIAGFTGQLRGWWDFYLTPTDQNNILNFIKIEPNGNPILINEQPLSDAVTTLVTAISI
ncbi:hypothetical protein RJ640_001304 [Escallonia rubra]|uniref:Uncharacterized protein n=1 Tax=Escallonia rubra TaxID=112253 RepID=A0AA88U476_9ASTE|nr:hypothetical protein RJ640_001304 [Escallonia rubra]